MTANVPIAHLMLPVRRQGRERVPLLRGAVDEGIAARTHVTAAGVAELRQALPRCFIAK
jgi:hypothetical protein